MTETDVSEERTQNSSAPGVESIEPAPTADGADLELSALRAEIAALRQREEAQATEVAGLRADLMAARETHENELSTLRVRLADAQQGRLDAHRRALLAEHAGQVVDELVTGSTVEELEASIETARAVYTRALEAARRELGQTSVPVGASPRGELNPAELSPMAKIATALSRR